MGRRVGGEGAPLSRQLLGWQLLMVVVLLAAVTVFSAIQSNKSFQDNEGRRMLSVAEDVAATTTVRATLVDLPHYTRLAPIATSARNLSGADYVIITLPDLTILTSPD